MRLRTWLSQSIELCKTLSDSGGGPEIEPPSARPAQAVSRSMDKSTGVKHKHLLVFMRGKESMLQFDPVVKRLEAPKNEK
jgi:hypothetical protein